MLVLASASPRRRELLLNAGIAFTVRPADVDEAVLPDEDALAHVRRLAIAKASAVAASPDDIVLGADTIVSLEGSILGKPASHSEAILMLKVLSGKTHEVHTGICLRYGVRTLVDVATTRVTFLHIDEADIDEYVRSGEPMDKAGAYGIQGIASRYVKSVEGCYFNVVGLPVSLVCQRLADLGWKPREWEGEAMASLG
ncbi:MAG: septum formation inhibitor Maf [Bryobacterales bacterium]|nr:septum formation inhibitor Maf [Bryobacterales bacterium]